MGAYEKHSYTAEWKDFNKFTKLTFEMAQIKDKVQLDAQHSG